MDISLHTRRDFMKTFTVTASALAAGCGTSGEQPPARPPNILWITCEDIGPALGCYGDDYATTPNLDRLASEGVIYRKAFATAPICAPARSCLITGVYATSMGTQHLRSDITRAKDIIHCIPEYLREKGYYCTNNSKTDYNFDPAGVWDENSGQAHWRNNPGDEPFFSVFNFGTTHEGRANSSDEAIFEGLEERHDPADAPLPPYYPDTPEFRNIWARQYDLITVMDSQAGEILDQLEEDGLAEDTIVVFFGDHGFGLPRYKRWCYRTGLHVPFIVRVPPKYSHLSPLSPGSTSDDMVSFVDLAPTTLTMAGIPVPEHMQGMSFLGGTADKRTHMYGARSRADDVYEVSRLVYDGRYIYIRNYMPHRPYIQRAVIFSDDKRSYAEFNRLHARGDLPEPAEAMYQPKAVEELYDLEEDPHELLNLADSPDHAGIRDRLASRLRAWILETRDTGFLHEAEMMIRSEGSTPYEMAQDPRQYDLERILDAAEMVGRDDVPAREVLDRLGDDDSGVRFWAATALIANTDSSPGVVDALSGALDDDSPSVRITAAEALCIRGVCDEALDVLARDVRDQQRPWVALQAARSIQCIGTRAEPLVPVIYEVLEENSGDVWGRYKNWLYPMFIGMALDQALINCGQELPGPIRS